jgi:hypothetical protein
MIRPRNNLAHAAFKCSFHFPFEGYCATAPRLPLAALTERI